MLLLGTATLTFNVQPIEAIGTIYIRADGSIDPPGAPISTVDNGIYTFTGNITSSDNGIIVERDNIIIDGDGYTIQGPTAYPRVFQGMILTGRSNVTIKNADIKYFYAGVNFCSASHNIISGNNITDTRLGIWLDSSSNFNIISGNNIITNPLDGIQLSSSSNCNSISENNIIANTRYSISLASCHNQIFHNNFVNNNVQVYSRISANIWDDGYPSGGNYWSAHNPPDFYSGPYQNETGRDRIGDIRYIINAWINQNNTDRYPLIYPYGYVPSPDLNKDETIDRFDLDTIAVSLGSVPGDNNWNPYADLNQDGIIDIFDLVIVAVNYGKTYP